jgi:hypothetical protein
MHYQQPAERSWGAGHGRHLDGAHRNYLTLRQKLRRTEVVGQ